SSWTCEAVSPWRNDAGAGALTYDRLSETLDRSSEGGVAMSQDTLSDVLRAVRLRGAVFYYIDGSSPWVAETPPAREIIPGIMPGAEHLIEFHSVVEGSCWGAVAGEPPIRLAQRDVILFPQGDPHVMSSAPGMRSPRVDREVYFAPRPPQLPYAL